MEGDYSTLKLTMEKGPLAGETLTFGSGSNVLIGRVVRGNTIAIKDAGVSSKHLAIRFDSASRKWTLTDLDSSNGTTLNSARLSPCAPTLLKDGDSIKIGEKTTIVVSIGVGEPTGLRRNPRRRGKAVAVGEGEDSRSRRAGGSIKPGLGFHDDLANNAVEMPAEKRDLRGRSRKVISIKSEAQEFDSIEVKAGRQENPRRTRGSKKEATLDPDSRLGGFLKALTVDASVFREHTNATVAGDGKTAGRVRGRKRNIRSEPSEKLDNGSLEENVGKQVSNGSERKSMVKEDFPNASPRPVRVDTVKEKEMIFGPENCVAVVESNAVNTEKEQDLEKMTLGEWFSYLEVCLPGEIQDATEELILGMRLGADKVQEFRLQQMNAKSKGKLPLN